ncbi:YebC/PmpR family DNA-binding transcriptional regulator, partial [Staphylococcus epidermidis]
PKELANVRDILEKKYTLANAELTMIPQNTTPVDPEKAEQFQRLIDALEDNDDVQEVYTAGELPEED